MRAPLPVLLPTRALGRAIRACTPRSKLELACDTAAVPPIEDLDDMLRMLSPRAHAGTFSFVTVDRLSPDLDPIMMFREDEGLTLVVSTEDAARAGLASETAMGWITLEVQSSLVGVGLTAAVSTALAAAGISCNVVAAYHHDHVFVPASMTDAAVAILHALSNARRDA